MFKITIVAGLMLTPALATAQPGNSMGTNAYAQPHSTTGDMASGAAGTPTHKSHMMHSKKTMRHTAKSSSMHSTTGMGGTTDEGSAPNAASPR